MAMQNLVVAMQNTVALHDLGAASGAITFFRSSAARSASRSWARSWPTRSRPASGEGHPLPVAFADATGHIFLVSAGIAALGVIATLFFRPCPPRETVEKEDTPGPRRRRSG